MIIITGASCSGKTTAARILKEKGYKEAISHTNRPIRDGEKDGVDYNFVSDETLHSYSLR